MVNKKGKRANIHKIPHFTWIQVCSNAHTYPLAPPILLESGRYSKPPHLPDIRPENRNKEEQGISNPGYPVHFLEEVVLLEVMYCSPSYHKLVKCLRGHDHVYTHLWGYLFSVRGLQTPCRRFFENKRASCKLQHLSRVIWVRQLLCSPSLELKASEGKRFPKKGKIINFDFDKESINIQLGSILAIYYQTMTKPSTFPSENQKTWPP